MTITGTTRVFYILGDPVAQVRAPEVYNPLFREHGIDAVLVPLKLPASALQGFLQHGLAAENIGGFCHDAAQARAGGTAATDRPCGPDRRGGQCGAALARRATAAVIAALPPQAR